METKDEGEEIVFHYKKGSFRERESKAVRDLATGETPISRGFFKSLVATKGNRFMFMALVIMIALCFILWMFNSNPETNSLTNLNAKVSAFSFENSVFVKLEFYPIRNKEPSENIHVSLKIDAVNTDDDVQNTVESDFTYNVDGEKSQFLTLKMEDYDIKKVRCFISDSGRNIEIWCPVIR